MTTTSDRIVLRENYDVVMARQRARELSRDLGFGLTDQTRISTAVSEVARQALESHGTVFFTLITSGSRQGIQCVCEGFKRPSQERLPMYPSTDGGAPMGLEGVRHLMDDFELDCHGEQITIVMRKWLK